LWSSPYDPKKRKRILKKHSEIFLEFLFFLKASKQKREKQKREKLFTRESSQQAKRRTRRSFWVFFLILQVSMHGK